MMREIDELRKKQTFVNKRLNWRKEPDWKIKSTCEADRWGREVSTARYDPGDGCIHARIRLEHLQEFHQWISGLIADAGVQPYNGGE